MAGSVAKIDYAKTNNRFTERTSDTSAQDNTAYLKIEIMEKNINCCETLHEVMHNFGWHSFEINQDEKCLVMPYLEGVKDDVKFRVNFCPSCGKEIRNIEVRVAK